MFTLQHLLQKELQLTLGNVGILLGVAFCFGLAYFIWRTNSSNKAARNCMALLVLSISVLALVHVVQSEYPAWQQAVYTLVSLQMTHGPLLYLYTRFQTESSFHWRNRYLWHFLPAVLSASLWWWQLPLSSEHLLCINCDLAAKADLLSQNRSLHRYAAWLSLLAYALWVLHILKPHEQRIKAVYSAIEDVNLRWVKAIVWTIIALTLLVICARLLHLAGLSNVFTGADIQLLAPFAVIFIIARYGVRQVDIQLDHSHQLPSEVKAEKAAISAALSDVNDSHNNNTSRKYKTSSLTTTDAAKLWQRLQQLMQNDAPYEEPGLKISELAAMLDVPQHHLSETINGYAQLSFYDYINQLRLEEALRLMSEPGLNLSVTDIGFQAGFNSTSTFFSQFKKRYQQTPKQMRKTLQNQHNKIMPELKITTNLQIQ